MEAALDAAAAAGVETAVFHADSRVLAEEWDDELVRECTDAAMCLDTGHARATGHDGAWQAEFLRKHGDRVSHVHLNHTRRSDDDEHLPVGLGRVDFGALADAIAETGWTGTCTHELFGFDLRYAAESKRAFDALLADGR
ncbi:hypothetical protein BRC81_10275 [Halobacteriales archaeon QS_1_68_20]|nr:MAG: hypothetical protein BRC81_10275 [Halobacteriales archaeon QS_1_68_20]